MREWFDCKRRETIAVNAGGVGIGGNNRVRIQSMGTVSTMDTERCAAQCIRIAEAGAELVRFTAQGVREAVNLGEVRRIVREHGVEVPIVADIHFNPRAAFAAAETVDKVRINPGNFVDPGRTFVKLEYTDEEYKNELKRIEEAVKPFIEVCRKNGTAVRIGVNHGSLSDRIMSRYGDTPAGMAESAMEYLRVFEKEDFHDVVISVKASNVTVMVETVRRLVKAMEDEGMKFPLHLGVTEAGDGEDGRIKSAVGIGSLLADGIGDTIRVSLSEEPECEIPVAQMLVEYMETLEKAPHIEGLMMAGYDPINPSRRGSRAVGIVGGENKVVVVGKNRDEAYEKEFIPDLYADDLKGVRVDAAQPIGEWPLISKDDVIILTSSHENFPGSIAAAFHAMGESGIVNPVIIHCKYDGISAENAMIQASVDVGSVLMKGFGDGVWIEGDGMSDAEFVRLAYGILQACRIRMSHTEYIACPGCGRTLFNLQETLRKVREATATMGGGVKIGVMGCIVNGPGEMADADYGYVGAATGHISLYRGKECVEKNIPEENAVEKLVELLKKDGKWK